MTLEDLLPEGEIYGSEGLPPDFIRTKQSDPLALIFYV